MKQGRERPSRSRLLASQKKKEEGAVGDGDEQEQKGLLDLQVTRQNVFKGVTGQLTFCESQATQI